jgi:hypothetical protein
MLTSREGFAVVVIGDYIYAIGGTVSELEGLSAVERARINTDGTLGTWEAAPSMTVGRIDLAAFVSGNYVYAAWGWDVQSTSWGGLCVPQDTIERAPINPDGSLGSWQVVATRPIGRHHIATAYVNGDIYVSGGYTATQSSNANLNSVDKISITPDGSIGQLVAMPAMKLARYSHALIAVGPYLYAIGGYNDTYGGFLDSVERAPLIIDTTPPSVDAFAVNGGALASTSPTVTLTASVSDTQSAVTAMSFSHDGTAWSDWRPYATTTTWALAGDDGPKAVFARFQDFAGNVSAVVSDTIQLDTSVAPYSGITINDGSLFTNRTAVALTISAYAGTAQMLVSNDGGFAGAIWEPYTARRPWTITQYGNFIIPRVVYVRYKDVGGTVSGVYQDDIILDMAPPEGRIEVVAGGSPVAALRPKGSRPASAGVTAGFTPTQAIYLPLVVRSDYVPVTLVLWATDSVSGVDQMMVSDQASFAGAAWQPYATRVGWLAVARAATTFRVKFRDFAGNESVVYTDTFAPAMK